MNSVVECWACGHPVESSTPDEHGYTRCAQCQLRFYPDGTAPRDQYTSDYFEIYAGTGYYAMEHARRYDARRRLALIRTHCPGAHDLLEIGSAGGFFLDEARKAGYTPVGIEPVESAATRAHEELGVTVIVGWAEEVDLPPASFDVVCMWHSLEHIPAPVPVLEAAHRALRRGGKLLLEVPNGASIIAQHKGSDWYAFAPGWHVGQWTPAAIRAVLKRAGFATESVNTVPPFVYYPRWYERIPRRVLHAIRQRRALRDEHPDAHDLLRAVASG